MVLLLALLACGPRDAPRERDGRSLDVGALRFDGPAPKNLLMISIDTLRKDHVGRYAAGESLTPFVDGLAAQSVVLDDFAQCSNWTFGSVPCTLGGRDHVDAGFVPRLDRDLRVPFPAGTPFLAGHLAEAGFDTWLFSINTWLSAQWGTSQGYAHEIWPAIFHTDEIVRRAADDLEEGIAGHDEPWFAHIHVKEPHVPYRAPSAYNEALDALPPVPWDLDDYYVHYDVIDDLYGDLTDDERDLLELHLRTRYASTVRWLDDQLAERWADLERRGLLDDTLVVIWTDHGEQFWERGHQTHAWDLYGEETDAVALIWAKNLEPGAWVGPTAAIDLAPTLLAVFDVEPTIPLTGAVVGEAPDDRVRFRSTAGRAGPMTAIERDGLELIFDWSGAVHAHDRRVDPLESTDVSDPSDPAQLALWSALRDRVEAEAALLPEHDPAWPAGWP